MGQRRGWLHKVGQPCDGHSSAPTSRTSCVLLRPLAAAFACSMPRGCAISGENPAGWVDLGPLSNTALSPPYIPRCCPGREDLHCCSLTLSQEAGYTTAITNIRAFVTSPEWGLRGKLTGGQVLFYPPASFAVCQTTALSRATNALGRALLPKKLARLRASRGDSLVSTE